MLKKKTIQLISRVIVIVLVLSLIAGLIIPVVM